MKGIFTVLSIIGIAGVSYVSYAVGYAKGYSECTKSVTSDLEKVMKKCNINYEENEN